jgi:hypothetical protein
MDCEQYALGIYDSATREMTPRILTTDSVMTSLGWLKHKNTNGLEPAAVVLTSTDNDQAWVRVSASPIAEDLGTAAARELARRYGGDLAAAKWRQYGRLVGCTNRKPDGQPPAAGDAGRHGMRPVGPDVQRGAIARPEPPLRWARMARRRPHS